MCHGCSSKTFRLEPLPSSIQAIRERLSRDRRWSAQRKGADDKRIYTSNRRVGDRRQGAIEPGDYMDATDLVVEIFDRHDAGDEQTRIQLRE
jgi:hypothetical protein